jgi:hypothetical protein
MKCPHCCVAIHEVWQETPITSHQEAWWKIAGKTCPECNGLILELRRYDQGPGGYDIGYRLLVHPKVASRAGLSPSVPLQFAADYSEACLVVADSPKASAALSRRCVQHLLREQAKVKQGNLSEEIQEVLDAKALPVYLAEAIDGIRNIGNFAAHPMKSKQTGEIVEVEPGEADWLLDTLEGLFNFYFVQPDLLRKRQEALNEKLKQVGKPPMKK